MPNRFTTPIIFLIFNRPDETARVFAEIRRVKPPRLYIVADGPRDEIEAKRTDSVREIVARIDWPCDVYRNYSEVNLGCRKRVWSGLDWAFERLDHDTDGAIVLEDDCMPDQSFFYFCEEMLETYKDDERVMHIGGVNFQPKPQKNAGSGESYYFSRIAQIWGWATWKRAWKRYDGQMSSWPQVRGSQDFRRALPDVISRQYWAYQFDRMYKGTMDTWDVAWTYSVFKEHGICIMPQTNLIENIGSATATHKTSALMHVERQSLNFPLVHPKSRKDVAVDEVADRYTSVKVYGQDFGAGRLFKAWIKESWSFLKNR